MSANVLNWIWLNPFSGWPVDYLGTLETFRKVKNDFEGTFETFRKVAANHSITDKFLWVDGKQHDFLTKERRDWVESTGVEIKDLRTIKKYAENAAFEVEDQEFVIEIGKFYQLVDMAKILILDHCLNELKYPKAFFTDLDIEADLSQPNIRETLQKYSMVFGDRAYSTRGIITLENQFIGFDNNALNFINNDLLPEMNKVLSSESTDYGLWSAMLRALKKAFPHEQTEAHLFLNLTTKMPQFYRQFGWSPESG